MKLPSFDFSKDELRDALRLAVQSAVAAATIFTVLQALGLPERFVGVLSAVLVVQPSVGSTVGAAAKRFSATIVGSLVGLACLYALPYGYGTSIALALSMFVMNGLAGLRPEWRYGVVAAVALSLGAESNAVETAQMRALSIGMGVVLGSLTSVFVWPDSGLKRTARHLRAAMSALADRLDAAIDTVSGSKETETWKDAGRRFHAHLEDARGAAESIRLDDGERALQQVDATDRLHNSVLILNRVAERSGDQEEGDHEFQERVDAVRDEGCAILRKLADGATDLESQLGGVKDLLESAQHAIGGDDQGSDERVLQSTLVFGLHEVERALGELLDAFSEPEQVHVGIGVAALDVEEASDDAKDEFARDA